MRLILLFVLMSMLIVPHAAANEVTPTPTPFPPRQVPHFYLGRPIASGGLDELDRTYPYGDTARGAWPVHHGVEFQNPRGTPVLAAASGTVIHSGDDFNLMFGPRFEYYGNLVVVAHDFTSPTGEPVFTLYGHLDRSDVVVGQRLEPGDRVGVVGATGIAIGPHLHFEVRVGNPYEFSATRNPDLWIFPKSGTAMLAGRVVDENGEPVPSVPVQLRRAGATSTNILYYAFSYASDDVNSSASWNENFTRGDLRPGDYDVFVSTLYGRKLFEDMVTLEAGEITWIEIVIPRGHIFYPGQTPEPTEANSVG